MMKEQFRGFLGYDEEEFSELWRNALFVVDTNILINFYKYSSKASTNSLYSILIRIRDLGRLWIPHQVAMEYFFNYESNMFKQFEGYDVLGKDLKKLKGNAEKVLRSVKSEHPYINTHTFEFFIKSLHQANEELTDKLEAVKGNLPNAKSTKEDILRLMDGIIGESYSQDKIKKIEIEGEERYKDNVPPGYEDSEDKDSDDIRTYGSIKYQKKFGDLIMWNQIIDKVLSLEEPTPIILITEEQKEDWWEKEGRNIIRPQPHLIQEFFEKTGQEFYMYRTDKFIEYAKENLDTGVTEEQVENVIKEVEYIRKTDDEKEDVLTNNDSENSSLGKKTFEKYKRDLDVKELLKYLSSEEKSTFKKRISNAFHYEYDPAMSHAKYNQAIDWALICSVNKLEVTAKNKVEEIALKDYKEAQKAIKQLSNLPNGKVERGIVLLNLIEKLDTQIMLYTDYGLPF